jgi:hypothetical protein
MAGIDVAEAAASPESPEPPAPDAQAPAALEPPATDMNLRAAAEVNLPNLAVWLPEGNEYKGATERASVPVSVEARQGSEPLSWIGWYVNDDNVPRRFSSTYHIRANTGSGRRTWRFRIFLGKATK